MMLTVVLAGLLVSVAAFFNAAPPEQSLRASDKVCTTVRLLTQDLLTESREVSEKVLEELCKAGRRHVLQQAVKPLHPRSTGQFAVLNLHRDAFSERVRWEAGDVMNVMADTDWLVDEEETVPAGQGAVATAAGTFYHWYRHGFPIWPLLNQTLAKTTRHNIFPFGRSKRPEWPNYALATPLYLVSYERNNYRDPNVSINKVFSKLQNNKRETFAKPLEFKEFVRKFYLEASDSIQKHPDNLRNWLALLLDLSLPHMMASFKVKQRARAPKNSKISRCPDQLYVFLLRKPCQNDLVQLTQDLARLLTVEDCSNITSVVVGYSGSVPPLAC